MPLQKYICSNNKNDGYDLLHIYYITSIVEMLAAKGNNVNN